jgi:phosphatidylglycerol:prolipoprotein diacylglycerol transferase
MLAAIPFFQLQVYNLLIPGFGTLPIDPWATLVCIGFVVGLEVARYRGLRLGLDVRDIVDGAVFIVLSGFLWGHILTVLFYFPERLQESGVMALLRVWEGFSSTGGFLGAVIGAWMFYKYVRPRPAGWTGPWALRHSDVIAFGFPFGWFFGRLGCGSVHDHIGKVTTFPLAMDFDHGFGPWAQGAGWVHGVRHELGLYEAALLVPLMIAFAVLGRKDRVPGFFIGLFAACYAPVRFGLEFLRNDDLAQHHDARYFGLTPAQYGMVLMGLAGIALLARLDHRGWRGVDLRPAPPPPEPAPPTDASAGADPPAG